jgi:hypothetical protein
MTSAQKQVCGLAAMLGIEIVLLGACFLFPALLRRLWPAYVIEIALLGPVAAALLLLVKHQWSIRAAIIALAVQSVIILVLFAQVYTAVGVGGDGPVDPTFRDGLYFSIVTWTTVGYGDFKPVPELRLFAACEALYGYIFLGLIVGLIGSLFRD